MAQIGEFRYFDGSNIKVLPVFNRSDGTYYGIEKMFRVETGGGTGFVPTTTFEPPSSQYEDLRIYQNGTVRLYDQKSTPRLITDFETGGAESLLSPFSVKGFGYTVETDNPISGSSSAKINSNGSRASVGYGRNDPLTDSAQVQMRIESQTSDPNDAASIYFDGDNNTVGGGVGKLLFYSSGDIVWDDNNSSITLSSWQTGTVYTCKFYNFDTGNNTVDVDINGSIFSSLPIATDVSGWFSVFADNQTIFSDETRIIYADNFVVNPTGDFVF